MKTSLLIMAAGIGSRFGTGIKQLAKVYDSYIVMDYSIHDAIEAGFNEIIFIIRKDIENEFRECVGNRIEKICSAHDVEVKYAFQDINDIPGRKPENRSKPWGTGQAVLAAKDLISSSFAVINADDYYGKEVYRSMHDWLILEHEPNAYAMAGFVLKNTLSDNGGVTRGICEVNENRTQVVNIVETSNVIKTENGVSADGLVLDPDTYVSMNFWGFPGNPPEFLGVLENGFVFFFKTDVPSNPLKSEYLLPTIIGRMLRKNDCTVTLLQTHDTWYGMTYKEDAASVADHFDEMIREGKYKRELYSDLH